MLPFRKDTSPLPFRNDGLSGVSGKKRGYEQDLEVETLISLY